MLLAVLIAACGEPSGPTATPGSSGPVASSTATADPTPPSPIGFWTAAALALGKTGRLRVIAVGAAPNELRYEPRASAALDAGELLVVCLANEAYDINGFRAKPRPARWACGTNALVTSFRRTGRPVEAWNATLTVDTNVRERIVADGRDRWRWEYTATSKALGGQVRSTLLMDVATGRLLSGTRVDPTGSSRWTFSYTQLFSPVELP